MLVQTLVTLRYKSFKENGLTLKVHSIITIQNTRSMSIELYTKENYTC